MTVNELLKMMREYVTERAIDAGEAKAQAWFADERERAERLQIEVWAMSELLGYAEELIAEEALAEEVEENVKG